MRFLKSCFLTRCGEAARLLSSWSTNPYRLHAWQLLELVAETPRKAVVVEGWGGVGMCGVGGKGL